ncbi:activator-dependent family glycosyltransferase [Streptosporangium sp. NPDC002544]|uniref:activator-dependent family glycosyltransferase n=1 Tax=Streptosporangium sp. NPDC002544 TaxID=3154538 RepID=UPI0033175B90
MRILFTTYPERTHFLLLAPLAWALRTAGHEVRVAVQPKFADVVTQAGLTAVPIGTDRDLWQYLGRLKEMAHAKKEWTEEWTGSKEVGWPTPYAAAEWEPEDVDWDYLRNGYELQIGQWHKQSNVPMISSLVEFAQSWQPDLVVWEPTTYAGAIAAKACGAAHARLLIGADVYGITRDHFLRLTAERPEDDRADPMADWLGSYARKYGFDFTEELITGQFTIDMLPPSLRMRANLNYLPLRYTPYGGPAVVPKWLSTPPERTRVAITMGLTVTDRAVGYPVDVQDLFDALGDLDIEIVATIVEEEQKKLARIPDNIRPVPYVPLQALLASCSAVIHHAGVGTLATTALQGLPQLSLPWDVDQPALAERLAAQGAGLAVHAAKATGEAVRENLLRLLNEPSFVQGAARLREEFLAMPTPNELVPRLEELVAEHRGDG